MRVLLTGAAGFIGSAVAGRSPTPATRWSPVDLMLPQAHGAVEPPPGVHRLDVRDAARGSTCCAASTSSSTRPPWSARASRWPTSRRTRLTTTSAPPRCWPRCTRRASTGWCWRPRWWSTARAATAVPTTGAAGAAARRRGARGRRLRGRLPGVRRTDGVGAGRRVGAAGPAVVATPPARSPRSTTPPPGCGRRRPRPSRCATTTSTGRGCRATRPTPGSPRSSGPPSSGARRPGSSRTAARRATSSTSPTSRRANVAALRRSSTGRWGGSTPYNVCSGSPGHDPRRRAPVGGGDRHRRRPRGHRRLPVRRRTPRRRLAAAGHRRARLHRPDRPRRGAGRVRDRSACAPDPSVGWTSPGRVEQVLEQQRRDQLGGQQRRDASGRAAARVTSSSHGIHGSQIRSTSALLIPDRSATQDRAPRSGREQCRHPHPGVRPTSRCATSSPVPAPRAGPQAEGEGAEVAPDPVRRGPLAGQPVLVALAQHRERLPPREAPPANASTTSAAAAATIGSGRQARARNSTASASGPSSGRPYDSITQLPSSSPATTDQPAIGPVRPEVAREGQRGQPPRGDGGEHRVGGHGVPDAGGPRTRNGAARRAAASAPSRRSVTSTATAMLAASATVDQSGGDGRRRARSATRPT